MRYLLLLLLSGCAGMQEFVEEATEDVVIYAELSVAHQLDEQTDYWLQTERSHQCDSGPQAHGELGLMKGPWSLGLHHQSWWLCGGPVNDKPEVYQNDIRLKYRKEWEKWW